MGIVTNSKEERKSSPKVKRTRRKNHHVIGEINRLHKLKWLLRLFFWLLFVCSASIIYWRDYSNLRSLINFMGGTYSLGNPPAALIYILAALLIWKIVEALFSVFSRLPNKIVSYATVILYTAGSWFVFGLGHAFPKELEKSILRNKEAVAEYHKRFVDYYGQVRSEAAGYKDAYRARLERLIAIEGSPAAGHCKYHCQLYQKLAAQLEEKWRPLDQRLRNIKESVEREYTPAAMLEVVFDLDSAGEMVEKSNRLFAQAVSAVDQAVSELPELRAEIERQFDIITIETRDTILAKYKNLPVQEKPRWPEWTPLSEEKRRGLLISRQQALPYLASFLAPFTNPTIFLVLFVLVVGFYIGALLFDRQYLADSLAFRSEELINHSVKDWQCRLSIVLPKEWEKYISSGFSAKSGKYYCYYLKESSQNQQYFKKLYAICEDIRASRKTLHIRPEVEFGIVLRPDKIRIHEVLKTMLVSSDFIRSVWPDLRDYNTEELLQGIKKNIGHFKPEKIVLPCSRQEVRTLLQMGQFAVPPALDSNLQEGLRLIKDYLVKAFPDLKYADLLEINGNRVRIVPELRSLLTDLRLDMEICEYRPATTVTQASIFDEIENELDQMSLSAYSIEKLKQLETRLEKIHDHWLSRPQVPVRVYIELAREYNNRAQWQEAERMVEKLISFQKQIPPNPTLQDVIREKLGELRLVRAHNLADLLRYDEALNEIDDLLIETGNLENNLTWKAYTAKGHIQSICGRAQEAVGLLRKPYRRLPLAERMQTGLTLVRSLVNTKQKPKLLQAKTLLETIHQTLKEKEEGYIKERENNLRYLQLERCRLAYVALCRGKKRPRLAEKEIYEFTNHWPEKLSCQDHPELIAIHLKNMLALIANKPAGPSDFYLNLASYVADNARKQPTILVALYALATGSWLWLARKRGLDRNLINPLVEICMSWQTEKASEENPHSRIRDFLADINDTIKDINEKKSLAKTGQKLCALMARAEYLPAVLPRN